MAAAALASSARARAGGEDEKSKKTEGPAASAQVDTSVSASVGVGTAEHAAAHEDIRRGEGKKDEDEGSFHAGVDFVVGTAHTPAVSQAQSTPNQLLGTSSVGTAKATSYSFVFNGEYEFSHEFGIALKVPLVTASFFVPGADRGASAIGDVEIEPEYKVKLADGLHLKLGLGLALPTAQGTEVPANTAAVPALGPGIDQAGYDRFAAQKAAEIARGYENDELFEPEHFGIVPKITLAWSSDALHIDPWVKLENLVATSSDAKFIDEFVMGVNFGYRVSHAFEPVLRVWGNIPVSNVDFTAVAVAEPQLRFHLGPVDATTGVILPFAGPLTSPYDFGVRLALGARF